jgi:hypothetical protein
MARTLVKDSLTDALCQTRVVYSLIIINKAGGLVYQREFQTRLQKLSTNDYLVLAGTFHGYVCAVLSLPPHLIPVRLLYVSFPAASYREKGKARETGRVMREFWDALVLRYASADKIMLNLFLTIKGSCNHTFLNPSDTDCFSFCSIEHHHLWHLGFDDCCIHRLDPAKSFPSKNWHRNPGD